MKTKLKNIVQKSHRYIGIPLTLIIAYMCLSGILLNHKEIIKDYDWPGSLLPSDMKIRNWGRGAITTASKYKNSKFLLGGRLGLLVADNENNITDLNTGLPKGIISRTVNSIYYDNHNDTIYAGLTSGLYKKTGNAKWARVKKIESSIISIIKPQNTIMVFTSDNCYIEKGSSFIKSENFRQESISFTNDKMSLLEFVFKLHCGELFGTPGKIIVDMAAFLLFILSISGFIFFISPLRKRSRFKIFNKIKNKLGKFHLTHHRKYGLPFVIIMIMFAITGFFMRPPFILALLGRDVNIEYDDKSELSSWNHSIRRVILSHDRKSLFIISENHIFSGPIDFKKAFTIQSNSIPGHPMGVTSFTIVDKNKIILGSFSGLIEWKSDRNDYIDYYTGEAIAGMKIKQSGPYQVNGAFTIDGKTIIADYRKGLFDLASGKNFIKMPDKYLEDSTFSLWNFLFELHNGRIYRSLIDKFYILVNPLVSLLFLILMISGIFYRIKVRKK